MRDSHILTIGYARQALNIFTREHERFLMYASSLGSLHVIVFIKKGEGFVQPIQNGNPSLFFLLGQR